MTSILRGPWGSLVGASAAHTAAAPRENWGSPAASHRVKGQPYRVPRHVPRTLTREQRFVFDDMARGGLTALWVAGDLDGPQARRLGDNRGAWPVLMGLTQAWADSKSATLIANEPYRTRAIMMRLWAETWDAADMIWTLTYNGLRHRLTEDTRGEWLSFEPETVLGDISAEILTHAQARNIPLRTDDEILEDIDMVIAMARKLPRGAE